MGPDFNFEAWADSWLKSTGITTIEPFPTQDESGNISFISIKQTAEGQSSELREMMIDIAIYDDDMNRKLI
jgi:hypothetical protein